MRCESDVYYRILWDERLKAEDFSIGYLSSDEDTKEQIVTEIPFGEFPQGIVPMHRIRYFKYHGFIVWDRKNQIDNFFGSTTSTQKKNGVSRSNIETIMQLMKSH